MLTRVDLTFSGENASSFRQFLYDPSGNMTRRIVQTDGAPTVTEERDSDSWPAADRINELNQILRNDITTERDLTVTVRYARDLDGNNISKTEWHRVRNLTDASDVVSTVSAEDIAFVTVGADFPRGFSRRHDGSPMWTRPAS